MSSLGYFQPLQGLLSRVSGSWIAKTQGIVVISGMLAVLFQHLVIKKLIPTPPSLEEAHPKKKRTQHDYVLIPERFSILVFSHGDEERLDALCAEMLAPLEADESHVVVLGLDAEWKPHTKNVRNKIALLQLCDERRCLLIRLFQLQYIPPMLEELLKNPRVLKSGVGIINDVRQVWRDYQIDIRGCVSLEPIAVKHNLAENGTGLSSLAWTILEIDVQKNHAIQCGNWERASLNHQQISYAATDAWVGRELLIKMHTSFGHPEEIAHWVQPFLDRRPDKFVNKNRTGTPQQKTPKPFRTHVRQSVLYENCKMMSPEGEFLCSISKKKAKWYLDRDIAEKLSDDPLVIRLKFTPKGKGHSDDPFYLAVKHNRCAVCGTTEKYLRYSIVPHGFKKYFDQFIKGRDSHDIVLLCQVCLDKATNHNFFLKSQFSRELNIPLEGIGTKHTIDRDKSRLKTAAALLKSTEASKLPVSRRQELEDMLKQHLGKKDEDLTADDLEQIIQMATKVENPDFISFEQAVVNAIRKQGKEAVFEFVKRWRRHFLDSMQPKFLPEHWSIDHPLNDERQ